MEDWLGSLKANSSNPGGVDVQKILSGHHTWHAASHARPTYCNVCRDQLSGVTSHGLSCEICKFKVHKRCASKAISNCKWTTLASVGKDIIEDKHGNIHMPHQWMEGNLPVSAKCAVCEKTCGSVLRLQDWRCLWCRTSVHTACRPKHSVRCPLGLNHVSVVPPTAIHSIGTDDAWDAVRPHGCSPLLVFVNSKSGDNQGVKFLRRFRQILNPAQVFDLITSGPTLGLRLFRHFDPFRVLVCSGDGSVGWVLSEIDRLNMQLQCEIGVLPLGTGNDLARVLGWGASCDDDAYLPQLVERYEKASPKLLDRWSIMVYERNINVGDNGKLALNTGFVKKTNLVTTATAYEDSVLSHLTKILQSDQHNVVISSAKVLCETVKDFITKISNVTLIQGDEDFTSKCQSLKTKLDHLLLMLKEEQLRTDSSTDEMASASSSSPSNAPPSAHEKLISETREKNLSSNSNASTKLKKEQLLLRINSLKKAVRRVVEHTEKTVDDQNVSTTYPSNLCGRPTTYSSSDSKETSVVETQSSAVSPVAIPNVTSISPLPEIRRNSSCSNDINLVSLPVPREFADSRHNSLVEESEEKSSSIYSYLEKNSNQFESKFSSNNDINQEKNKKSTCDCIDSEEEFEERELESKMVDMDSLSLKEHVDSLEDDIILGKKFIGFLSEELANIGHIDSSETSDDSPEACGENKKYDDSKCEDTNRSSLRDSIKESDHSFPISIEGVCNLGSELDMTNLFSTSPEEEEECSEEYKREMGLDMSKRCSLAHFIEGSDIAKRSIKCRHRKKSLEDLDKECIAVSPELKERASVTTMLEIPKIEVFKDDSTTCAGKDGNGLTIGSSHGNLNSSNRLFPSDNDLKQDRRSCALSETDDEEFVKFHSLEKGEAMANSNSTGPTVIVDPPSPTHENEVEEDDISADHDSRAANEMFRKLSRSCRRLSAASPLMSVHCSPSPTRRISNISLMPSDCSDQKESHSSSDKPAKTLPIINPLVQLPQWPNINESGMISKVLLANADALCAAAVPLMDPDETLMEGFFERCVMNNYFGIGIDAKISLDFHHKREECPEKCRSRARNYMWYGVLGSKQWLQKTCKNLEQRVQLECDGQRIPLPSLEGIVVLNIPSFMGGINFWGGTKEDDVFLAPSMDDRILEVVAVFGTVQMAASRLINLQRHRIAQCSVIQITILGDEGVPVQVDGEAWIQPPGIIRIIHKNRMKLLCRNKLLENSLKTWEEKRRQMRHQNRMQSHFSRLAALSSDEIEILNAMINYGNTLVKQTKLSIVRHPSMDGDLYELASITGYSLKRVETTANTVPKAELRPAVTEAVLLVQRLVDEMNTVLHDKNIHISPSIERELQSCISQLEVELKKCYFAGSSQHSLVYLRTPSSEEVLNERKVTHGRRSSIGTFWQRFRRNSGVTAATKYSRAEVATWDVFDVGAWLECIQLGEYVESFYANDVRGSELLTLTRTDLKELGIMKLGHVKRLLSKIRDFTP